VRLVETQDALRASLSGSCALVVESLHVGNEELAAGSALRVVQKFGWRPRNIDTAACAAKGIKVLTIRRRANIACAEVAIALMLTLAKKLHRLSGRISVEQLREVGYAYKPFDRRHTSNSNWPRISGLRTLNGATLGLIGLGEIGREIAIRAAAFGMRILYYQRTRLPAAEEHELKATYAPQEKLLAESDCRIDRGAEIGPAQRLRPRPPLRGARPRRRRAVAFRQRGPDAAHRGAAALQRAR
jgi:glyoxylate reductase/D-3-phosphoglycerate dehydrogenase